MNKEAPVAQFGVLSQNLAENPREMVKSLQQDSPSPSQELKQGKESNMKQQRKSLDCYFL
jgi:hypothetical protein